jgi:calcineurin-like phosphoesterase family protein
MIYFTADTHFGHKNLVRGCTSWVNKNQCRDFSSLLEHDEFLIKSINSSVGYEDTLYHLGDWSFGGFENIERFSRRINCQNVHLILGNHDTHIAENREDSQELFSSVQHYAEVTIEGQTIVLSHWPMKIWNGYHKGWWHLHGHCHNNLKPDEWWTRMTHKERRKTMDVGVDTNNFRVWSFEELKRIMSKLNSYPKDLDHHSSVSGE